LVDFSEKQENSEKTENSSDNFVDERERGVVCDGEISHHKYN